jgi:hypothetical protein
MRLKWLLTSLLALAACSNSPPPIEANTTWESHCDPVVPSEIQACYGPVRPANSRTYTIYEISVERIGRGSSSVLYSKQFPASEVAKRLINREQQPVVFYNPSNRIVKFDLGGPDASFRIR